MTDVDPPLPEAEWLRRWSQRQRCRQAINPPFPQGVFDYDTIRSGPVRCLFSIAELDDFARNEPNGIFEGFLSVLITDLKLVDCWKRQMLLCNECCNSPIYANAASVTCKSCEHRITLRLNPRILAQVIDESAAISGGSMLLGDGAWRDLLGHEPNGLLRLDLEQIKDIEARLLFARATLVFGYTGDESKAGGRICVLGVYN